MKSATTLKFRVWHSQRQELFEVVEIHNGNPTLISKQTVPGGPTSIEMLWSEALKYVTVMQCTGFRDANDQDIYVNDIVRCLNGPRAGISGIVGFQYGCYGVLFENPDADGFSGDMLSTMAEFGVLVTGFANPS